VLIRIFLFCSSLVIAWFLYIFYLILALCVSFISITSGQAYGNFDYHAKNLELKSGRILNQIEHFGFVSEHSNIAKIVLSNQSSFTDLLSIAPYLLGYQQEFKILFCTDHVFESGRESIELASIVFRNMIPQAITNPNLPKKNTKECNPALLEIYARNGDGDSINYDAFIWISNDLIKDINDVLIMNHLDDNSSLPKSFESFILKNWKVEYINSSLFYSILMAVSNGSFKIKFFDNDLDNQLVSSKLKLVLLST